ncbi:MAG: diguanylate cyclase, partial [Pikeienuella sp.]
QLDVDGRDQIGARVARAPSGFAAMSAVENQAPDAVIVADGLGLAGGLAEAENAAGIIGALRARPETRDAAIIHIAPPGGAARGAVAAFGAGATDSAPFAADPAEIAARLELRLRVKRSADALRVGLEDGLRLAAIDPLTGLHNRRYFEPHFARLCDRARESGQPLAALLFDLDRFKAVNDAHGHAAGDETLRVFARRLRAAVRGADLVARLGGEEFAVILQNTQPEQAVAAAERVRRAVASRPVAAHGGVDVRLTVSIGVAGLSAADADPAALLDRADAALRRAKRGGRDRVRIGAA